MGGVVVSGRRVYVLATRHGYPAGMQRINPRPIFSAAIRLIESDRCPECGRGYDPVAAAEDYCPRIKPLHCSWCSDRVRVIREYQAWLRQDAAAYRAARKKKAPG